MVAQQMHRASTADPETKENRHFWMSGLVSFTRHHHLNYLRCDGTRLLTKQRPHACTALISRRPKGFHSCRHLAAALFVSTIEIRKNHGEWTSAIGILALTPAIRKRKYFDSNIHCTFGTHQYVILSSVDYLHHHYCVKRKNYACSTFHYLDVIEVSFSSCQSG